MVLRWGRRAGRARNFGAPEMRAVVPFLLCEKQEVVGGNRRVLRTELQHKSPLGRLNPSFIAMRAINEHSWRTTTMVCRQVTGGPCRAECRRRRESHRCSIGVARCGCVAGDDYPQRVERATQNAGNGDDAAPSD